MIISVSNPYLTLLSTHAVPGLCYALHVCDLPPILVVLLMGKLGLRGSQSQSPVLFLTCCVTLGRSLALSESPSSYFYPISATVPTPHCLSNPPLAAKLYLLANHSKYYCEALL